MDINIKSLDNIIESLDEGLYFTDLDRKITFWNKSAEKISGYTKEEVVGSHCSDNILVHVDKNGNSLCKGKCPLALTMEDGCPRHSEVYLHHKEGHRVPVSVRVNTLIDANGKVIGGIELFTDLSTKEANQKRIEKLEKLALVDNLTQLVNRNYINKELTHLINNFNDMRVPFGILFIDIDKFKNINDIYGHKNGDEILKMVSNNLKSSSRAFDIFGRWGGEEFIGLIPNIKEETLIEIAERIRLKVENSFIFIDEKKVSVTISIGATISNKGDTIDQILERADKLLYKSKKDGRNRVTLVPLTSTIAK